MKKYQGIVPYTCEDCNFDCAECPVRLPDFAPEKTGPLEATVEFDGEQAHAIYVGNKDKLNSIIDSDGEVYSMCG